MIYETFWRHLRDELLSVKAPEGWILFDAPEGACDWLVSRNVNPKLLLLTHGHFDHIPDVAKIKDRFGCQIGCHSLTAPMISDPEFFRSFGFQLEIKPVEPDFFIEETLTRKFLGLEMQVLEVPGHCPGSLCFFLRQDQLLVGGDVLFAGSVGRGDLPGECRSFDRRDQTKVVPAGRRCDSAARARPRRKSELSETNPFVR
jgi:glyoxylase-like metal-dependent hydrolase (beta-lactamase superfamily II)